MIRQFHRSHPPHPAQRVDLLLATDCLAEGLDLRDARVVVHLDLPWTPARLAQRVGRAARLGAPLDDVHVHALRPAPAESRWLRLAARLRAKARHARHTLGDADGDPPGPGPTRDARPPARRGSRVTRDQRTPAARRARLDRRLERWLRLDLTPLPVSDVPAPRLWHAGAIGGAPQTALAVVRLPAGAAHLVAIVRGRASTRPGHLLPLVARLERDRRAGRLAPTTSPALADATRALRRTLARWARRRTALGAALGAAVTPRDRRPPGEHAPPDDSAAGRAA